MNSDGPPRRPTRLGTVDPKRFTDAELAPFAELLAHGGTVAFPTETVYGLGADATRPDAVAAIFAAKGRPSDNPLIVHIADADALPDLVTAVTPLARDLIEAFWPGPLTIILPRSARVPDAVTAGLDTVAVRMPAHPLARRLIGLAGVPVAAPSANRSGRPSPTRGHHVITDLLGRVDAIIDGGPCAIGLESTVVDATGRRPVVLRPGGVTAEMLAAVAGGVHLTHQADGDRTATPRSPGMKYTHYAPRARVVLAPDAAAGREAATQISALAQRHGGETVGVLCTDETAAALPSGITRPNHLKTLGSASDVEAMAAHLFLRLREFDDTDVTLILAEHVDEASLGQALMNRLAKAAGSDA